MDFWSILGKVSLGLGILLAVCFALFKQLTDSIAGWVTKRFQYGFDKQLEELRSELARDETVLRSSLAAASRDQSAVQEKTLDAVDRLWESLLAIRSAAREILFLYEFLTGAEIQDAFQDDRTRKTLDGVPAAYEESKKLLPLIADVELERPYLGERLWSIFSAYFVFANRMIVKTHQGVLNRQLFPWDEGGLGPLGARGGKDTGSLSLLASVLGEEQMEYVREKDFGAPQAVLAMLEQKLLIEIEHRGSGHHLSEGTVQEIERIRRSILHLQESEQYRENS